MYSNKKIPAPFLEKRAPSAPQTEPQSAPAPIEAKEKDLPPIQQGSFSPLAALLFMDLFAAQKKDGH